MQVSKEVARAVTEELEAAAEKIFAKHGLVRGKMSTKYGVSYSLTIAAEALELGDNGVNVSSREAQDYTAFAASYELPQGLLGKVFKINGVDYAFAGIATSRRKYPIYMKNLESGKMVFFQEGVKRYFTSTVGV